MSYPCFDYNQVLHTAWLLFLELKHLPRSLNVFVSSLKKKNDTNLGFQFHHVPSSLLLWNVTNTNYCLQLLENAAVHSIHRIKDNNAKIKYTIFSSFCLQILLSRLQLIKKLFTINQAVSG